MSDELSGIVRAGVSSVDDCPVLTRVRAFVVDQGVEATLEHVMAGRGGNAVDLTSIFGEDSLSSSSPAAGGVVLRVKEELGRGNGSATNPVWGIEGECVSASAGVVRASLVSAIVAKAGIYRLSWGIENAAGKLVLVNNGLLSVERSLFADIDTVGEDQGPLTIQSIRAYLRDSHPNENMRLADVEFGDEEIVGAILRPVEYYNEQPPPIGKATTQNFPSRYQWSQATIACLYETAAAWYRRNKQRIQAGGLVDDDLNRDQDYEMKYQTMWKAYTEWVTRDKVMRNAKLFVGDISSAYSGGFKGRW